MNNVGLACNGGAKAFRVIVMKIFHNSRNPRRTPFPLEPQGCHVRQHTHTSANVVFSYFFPFQEFGGNYYQPMIAYIHEKDVQGPFTERREIYMPDRAEVTSNKYSNM